MEKKLLCFDVDDTLIVTTENSVKSLYEVACIYGLKDTSPERIMGIFREYPGMRWEECVQIMWPGIDINDFRDFYKKHKPGIVYPAVEGAHDALEILKEMGHVLGILTNRSESLFHERMEESGYNMDSFDFYYTSDRVKKTKDMPGFYGILLEEAWRHGLGRQDILYTGDTLLDLESTERDGIDFIAVLTGLTSKEDFMKAGLEPGRILPSVAYLPEFLRA